MNQQRPKVLITNDDGINAPGIFHLWEALLPHADVTIVAPTSEQSGVSLSLTYRSPLMIQENQRFEQTPAWEVSGTPSDCVKMALRLLLDEKPDLVVSGINRGCNAGRNVLYSGTVGGAIEGTLQGISAIALSCRDSYDPHYHEAAAHVPALIDHILTHPLPEGTLLNVNFPYKKDSSASRGIKLARQGKGLWGESPEQRLHPGDGPPYYWMGAEFLEFPEDQESDIELLKQGYITAVPIQVSSLTDNRHYESHKNIFEKKLNKSLAW